MPMDLVRHEDHWQAEKCVRLLQTEAADWLIGGGVGPVHHSSLAARNFDALWDYGSRNFCD